MGYRFRFLCTILPHPKGPPGGGGGFPPGCDGHFWDASETLRLLFAFYCDVSDLRTPANLRMPVCVCVFLCVCVSVCVCVCVGILLFADL